MKTTKITTVIFSIIFIFTLTAQAAPIKRKDIIQVGRIKCALGKKGYKPVKRDGKKFIFNSSASKKQRTKCKTLINQNKFAGLSVIPSYSEMIGASSKTLDKNDVSGTPPTLLEIADSDVTSIFWNEGVVSRIAEGNPTEDDCAEFYGEINGQSAGLGGCFMAQEVGFSFENILTSGTSLCYMKNIPSQNNIDSGALTVVSGELPDNDITKLFETPSNAESRVVKLNITDPEFDSQIIIITVNGNTINNENSLLYSYDIRFCGELSDTPTDQEEGSIALNGDINIEHFGSTGPGGVFNGEITGRIINNQNEVQFDRASNRTALIQVTAPGNFNYKSSLTISANGEIESKAYATEGDYIRKGYSIAATTGNSVDTLRFLTGAYKEEEFLSSCEYQDTMYTAASSELSGRVDDYDTEQDQFYSSLPENLRTPADGGCNVTADIVLELDLANEDFNSTVAAICEGERFDGMNFCGDNNQIGLAMAMFGEVC